MSNVVVLAEHERRPSVASRELVRLMHKAHHRADQRPQIFRARHEISRAGVLTFEQFRRTPPRTSMYGYPL